MDIYPKREPTSKVCWWPKEAVPAWAHPESTKYLQHRGVSTDEIRQYRLAYAPTGYWHHRLLIPMYQKEVLTAFQGRSIDEHEPRYQTSGPRLLYCPIQPVVGHVVLVEGPFDAFAVARAHQGVIATLGNLMSEQQREMLLSIPEITRISILYDREALSAAYEIQLLLQPYIQTNVLEIQAKDPGEMTACQIKTLLQQQLIC